MNALLSIKPIYVKKILEGTKKYEFRKTIFRSDVKTIWIYESSPTKKIVGAFDVGKIITDTPESLWDNFKSKAGISKDDFFCYFDGKSKGYALEIKKLKLFKEPINPQDAIEDFHPPQSFCYFDGIPTAVLYESI
ncbi:MAG TPA: hypothetical protein PKH33_14240 [bacterium]|nr:hypothetical protein [bacterium]